MRELRYAVGVIGALMPILYCARLLYYFLNLSGSVEEAQKDGLGPTVFGLAAVGLLFCVFLVFKIVRSRPRPPAPEPRKPRPDPPADGGEGGFDADAVVARYMAARSTEAASGSTAAVSTPARDRPAKPSTFGRRIR